ncbi:MAG: hypothetical protein ISR77_00020 [Pirellulaceae bacterium]|nr:hypothetical protein [Pirellulaceae bacterium]
MNTQLQELRTWMDADEDEHLEFKEAKANFQMSEEGRIHSIGYRRAARWFPGSGTQKPQKSPKRRPKEQADGS